MSHSGWWEFTHGGPDRSDTFERSCGCKGTVVYDMGGADRTVTEPCPKHFEEES